MPSELRMSIFSPALRSTDRRGEPEALQRQVLVQGRLSEIARELGRLVSVLRRQNRGHYYIKVFVHERSADDEISLQNGALSASGPDTSSAQCSERHHRPSRRAPEHIIKADPLDVGLAD